MYIHSLTNKWGLMPRFKCKFRIVSMHLKNLRSEEPLPPESGRWRCQDIIQGWMLCDTHTVTGENWRCNENHKHQRRDHHHIYIIFLSLHQGWFFYQPNMDSIVCELTFILLVILFAIKLKKNINFKQKLCWWSATVANRSTPMHL